MEKDLIIKESKPTLKEILKDTKRIQENWKKEREYDALMPKENCDEN